LVRTRIERYLIEDCPGGVALKMRQAKNGLGVAAIASAVFVVSWWFGPRGPHPTDFGGWFYWVWSGLFGLGVVLGLLGALHREDWTITRRETTVTSSFAGWRRIRRLPRTRALAIRVEFARGMGNDGAIFPWQLQVLDDDTRDGSGLRVLLQRRGSVDRFLEALREVLPLDVDDTARRRR
jgi:hypothetical protein